MPGDLAGQETYFVKDGMKVIERFFVVPLNYAKPDEEKIRVFARHIIPKSKAKNAEDEKKLPFLVYLTGGPGFEVGLPTSAGYPGQIHDKGYQTLWIDQRGTGLSTSLSPDTLPPHVKTDEEIAEHLKHFRADNIVRDCEFIRKQLLGDREKSEDQKWTVLGQSFGGFCIVTYLSFHSEGLKEAFLTGGLAPLVDQPDIVYDALVQRVIKRNQVYYKKYPQDVQRVKQIVTFLEANEVVVPNNGHLTPHRFMQLGHDFGMSGGIDRVHQIVFRASSDLELFNKLSYKTLQTIQNSQPFDGNPLYAILHEPLYCQGQAAKWSAARVVEKHACFSWDKVKAQEESTPLYFTGEMIFPSMFDDYANLRPWKGAADILASDESWKPLYDKKQLEDNEVKVSTVTYLDDMYVDFGFAQQTANTIKNTEQYITNQLVHNGLGKDPADVMKTLFKLSEREFD
ncbi:alpha/beta-hydrolase [Crepidotus variabilis]|uniref:Alpha/beta-hydrolase n=1 Tax=Crepidotus variabilis TaxID=179855 RepID=A0A9P6JK34_9AGAR|nr:alpha/beta-hydrolase [Crepidotus variabilis]